MSPLANWTRALSLLATLSLIACGAWSLAVGQGDWAVLMPFFAWVFFGEAVALIGLVCAIVGASRGSEGPWRWAIPWNALLIIGPWAYFATRW